MTQYALHIYNEMIVDHRIIVELNAFILTDPCRGSNNLNRDYTNNLQLSDKTRVAAVISAAALALMPLCLLNLFEVYVGHLFFAALFAAGGITVRGACLGACLLSGAL